MIGIIAAIGKNRELGKNGDLIWRISDDLKRVKDLTTGHPIVMGRKTYESIGRPLPNRTNIVVTRDPSYEAEGCIVTTSLEEALEKAKESEGADEIFIFGGAQIYEMALPYTDRLYLTIIDAEDPEADTFFPEYDTFTNVIKKEKRDQDGLSYEWFTLEK
ncbi:dihydrofolate reductase [Candidatus Kaiserbacteria bacterium]|nr:dihydrofolate reductase [Candidatus Kaiserbacteria bacterium]